MSSPASSAEVQTLLNTVRRLEQRVRELEGSNRLVGNIPRGREIIVLDDDGDRVVSIGGPDGGLRIYDDSGLLLGYFGRLGDGSVGVTINKNGTNNTALAWTEQAGILAPYAYSPFISLANPVLVTSASHAQLYLSRINRMVSVDVESTVFVMAPVGTSYELRFGFLGGTNTVDTTRAGTGAIQRATASWKHAMPLGGGPYEWEWSVRRTAGAGNVSLYPPYNIALGQFAAATAPGAWLVV